MFLAFKFMIGNFLLWSEIVTSGELYRFADEEQKDKLFRAYTDIMLIKNELIEVAMSGDSGKEPGKSN